MDKNNRNCNSNDFPNELNYANSLKNMQQQEMNLVNDLNDKIKCIHDVHIYQPGSNFNNKN